MYVSLFVCTYFCLCAAVIPEFPLWGSMKDYLILSYLSLDLGTTKREASEDLGERERTHGNKRSEIQLGARPL